MFLLSALPALWNAEPIPLGSAESKKETNSLRPLRLCGDHKLSNYNTILYLRICALRFNQTVQQKVSVHHDGRIQAHCSGRVFLTASACET